MKRLPDRLRLLLALLVMTAFAATGACEMLDLSTLGDIEEAQMIEEERVWTYPIPYELLMNSDYLLLVNRDNLLDKRYVPADLVTDLACRKVSSTKIQLRQTAADALCVLFDAAKADGITLYAHSGYRSYQTQNTMYANRLKRMNGVDDGIVQYPGASEHQSGLAIDVINKAGIGKNFTNDAFAPSKEGKWLAENCWDYGFVIRYPEDKVEITGIKYESWHLRYVGVQVAQYMRDHNLCLEEFTEEWKEAVALYNAAE